MKKQTKAPTLRLHTGNRRLTAITSIFPSRKPAPKKGTVVTAAQVTPRQRLIMRSLVLAGLFTLALLCYWLFDKKFAGYKPLYLLLMVSIGYKILKVLFEWYHYWALRHPHPAPPLRRQWKVDMFTTAMPGEPFQLIKDTLEAMVAVRYPHTTYLCDEGNDPELKRLCDNLGVRHMTRTVKVNAKAGNINNALRSATGDICVILDPDHRPVPQLLEETLPYFEDPQIGFVQSVQAYKNAGESPVARGAAEQTYTFYGPLMMGMGSYGTAQAIGANCVFRRTALDSIGGHAPGLSEDMHTAMRLHAKGWKSVYVPKILTRGLVPSNISAFYKQQLKWSRGTFDLLFSVLPKIFGALSWRQKLHYSLIPLHFAAGIIALIDIIIPLVALLTAESPLLLEFSRAYLFLLPFFVMVLITRQYAQNWLIEPAERGFHLTGGFLLFGTWWVHLVGFIYTLLGIKVPYIPTPKEDEYRNNYLLSLPNFIVVVLSGIIVGYSLHYDSNPYNQIMAGYAVLNMALLLYVVWVGLDGWRVGLQSALRSRNGLARPLQKLAAAWQAVLAVLLGLMRRGAPQLALAATLLFAVLAWKSMDRSEQQINPLFKETGGFYLGVAAADKDYIETGLGRQQPEGGASANVRALSWRWQAASDVQAQIAALNKIAALGAMPMVNWLPVHFADTNNQDGIFTAIAKGVYDDFIRAYAQQISVLEYPLFLNFAPESDNPALPWAIGKKNPASQYLLAMRRVKDLFNEEGANNVSWMWTVARPANAALLYPGADFVDWIGVQERTIAQPLDQTYAAFHERLKVYRRPVMLLQVPVQNDAASFQWLQHTAQLVSSRYQEISGILLSQVPASASAVYTHTASTGNATLETIWKQYPALAATAVAEKRALPPVAAKRIQQTPKGYQMMVAGKPFYIKGVAYNLEHSWRDGYSPLNRKKLEADFKAIKAMGANTIRRYAPSAYDANILAVARDQQLKVMYGFWFDPKFDYYKDTDQVAKYIREVVRTVNQFKDDPTIIAWNIGNETSGILKDFYAQPYLTQVRKGYMAMIEQMVQAIHAADPVRPVISSLEHTDQLPGELLNFSRYTPSLDVMGVNSYYTTQISRLHQLSHRFNPGRPYLVTEFGPMGYWSPRYTQYDRFFNAMEDSDKRKAELYLEEWQLDVQGHEGCNLGGVAYCWQDRYEGSTTWFGITNQKGQKKLVYSALQYAWAGGAKPRLPHLFIAGPTFQLKPGGAFEFTAVNKDSSLHKFKWQLLREDYLEEAGEIYSGDKANKAWVFLPQTGKRFRLYVQAETREGQLVTASFPINMYQGVLNEGL